MCPRSGCLRTVRPTARRLPHKRQLSRALRLGRWPSLAHRLSVYLSAMIAKFSHDKQLSLLQKDKNLIVKQLRSLQH